VSASLTVPRAIGVLSLGFLAGAIGTGVHRASQPAGLILAFAIVASAAVTVRAWTGVGGVLAFDLALGATLVLLGLRGPGGDVLIPAQGIGYAWYASVLVVVAVLGLPRRWFSDRQLGGDADEETRSRRITDGMRTTKESDERAPG
jgi:hypothetical protein